MGHLWPVMAIPKVVLPPYNTQNMKRVIGIFTVLFGLILMGITIFRIVDGVFMGDLATSVLYASFGVLLLALAGYMFFS